MPQTPQGAVIAQKAGSTAFGPAKLDAQQALLISQRHGRNFLAALAASIGIAANPSGVTTSAGLATTCVGLILSNPAASGKNLVLLNASGSLIVAPSTITGFNLIGGFAAGGITVHTTPLTPLNGLLGNATALVGLVDSAATLVGTPAYLMPMGQSPTAIIAPFFNVDIGGSIVIPPGGYVAIGTTIAGPSSGFQGGFVWEEVPQ